MPSFRYYTESDVERTLSIPLAMDAMEGAFRGLAEGTAHNVPRVRSRAKGIVLHSMSAAADYLGLVGWKQYTTTRSGARFHVGVYNQQTGELTALIEADRLGQLRTGAVTGVAAKHLAEGTEQEAAIIGTGWQAETQLAAVAAALPLRRAWCFSRDPARRQKFAEQMSRQLGFDVTPTDSAEAAVRSCPLVITATTSSTPVVRGEWLASSTLVCAVGSNWLQKAELDVATVRRSSLVVCDDVECCRREAGDFVEAIDQGLFRWEDAVNLADVMSGRIDSANHTEGVRIFKSVGMAIEDLALAAKLLELV